jgi:RNA polymerase sigma factor (sigma-70 family)
MRGGELEPVILARACAGDPLAFRALYEHHAEAVYGFLQRMLRDRPAAEDALQDTFMRVLHALPGFDPGGPARLSTWIFTIARRVALTALERRPAAAAAPRDSWDPAVSIAPSADLRLTLEAAVAALPETLRGTFVLRSACDLSYEELAEVEGIDIGTVRSRLHRARAALQAMLRDDPAAASDERERSSHGTR